MRGRSRRGRYVAELQGIKSKNPAAAQVDLSSLREAAGQWGAASLALEARSASLTRDDSPSSRALRKVNRALMREERLLTTRQGIPGRPWFQHQIYAPRGQHRLRGAVPARIRDALDAGDAATVTKYRDLLLDSLRQVTARHGVRPGGAPPRRPSSRGSRPDRPPRPPRRRDGARGRRG